jgi:hypothetical protein
MFAAPSFEGRGACAQAKGAWPGEKSSVPEAALKPQQKGETTMSNFDDFWGSYKAEQAERQARLPQIKTFVIDQFRKHGVHSVHIEYDGENDSGQTNGIVGFDADHKHVEFTSLTAEPPADGHPLCTHLRQLIGTGSLLELADNFTWEVLGVYHDGFWNNDGGFGTLTINVDTGTVSLEHSDQYVNIDTTTTEV